MSEKLEVNKVKTSFVCLFFRLMWNITLEIFMWCIQIAWVIFLFSSVVGVVLLIIFYPKGFFLPFLYLAEFIIPPTECQNGE